MWCGLLRLDVVHVVLLHMVIVFAPPRGLDACMMTGMTVGVFVRQVEVTSVLRRAVIC